MFAVEERGKPENLKKKALGAGYLANQQTQRTYGAENGNRTQATLVESKVIALTTAPTLSRE